MARRTGVDLDRGEAIRTLEQAVADGVRAIVQGSDLFGNGLLAERCARLSALIAAADRLGFEIRAARAQEMLLDFLRARATHTPRTRLEPAIRLAERLHISDQAVTFKDATL